MLKENSLIFKIIIIILDTSLLFAAFALSYRIRSSFNPDGSIIFPLSWYLTIFYVSAPVIVLVLFRFGVYGSISNMSWSQLFLRTTGGVITASVVCAAFLFLTKSAYFSRLLFGSYFLFGTLFLMIEKFILKGIQALLLQKGIGRKNILIIGSGKKLQDLLGQFRRNDCINAYNIKRVINVSSNERLLQKDIEKYLASEVVDEVYVAFSRDKNDGIRKDIESILTRIEEYGKPIKLLINLDEVLRVSKVNFSRIQNLPILVFYSKTMDPDLLLIKRMLDIIGSLIGLCFTMAVFPFVSIAIKLDSQGPVIFSQVRIGLNGRRFHLYKFRSMYVNAENKKSEIKYMNELDGPIFKSSKDPRITRVGHFLRKTSLDELPQFWNVLKGDMSLVGTRPPTPDEVEHYKAWHYRRISIKPGMTGLWQVEGRNKIKNFDEIVALDVKYIQNWSLLLDFKILIKTVYLLFLPNKAGAM